MFFFFFHSLSRHLMNIYHYQVLVFDIEGNMTCALENLCSWNHLCNQKTINRIKYSKIPKMTRKISESKNNSTRCDEQGLTKARP